MSAVLDRLIESLGPDRIVIGPDIPERNHADASGLAPTPPAALILPRSTQDVATALRICHAHRQPVVTQGGLTGLAGGAHPQEGEIALSLERMSGIEEIDEASATLTALAGTPLAVVQQAAEEAGFLCGIDLGARGTCTIGGNIATNAGGNQVLRYGMARRNTLGLEVVLADWHGGALAQQDAEEQCGLRLDPALHRLRGDARRRHPSGDRPPAQASGYPDRAVRGIEP
jgi:FAD/FMN-containing dehydrogenase